MTTDALPQLIKLIPEPTPAVRLRTTARVLMALGALLVAAALFSPANRERLAHAYLWAFACGWGLSLGALLFIALTHLTHAVWSVVVRRTAEMIAAPIGWMAALFVGVLIALWASGTFPLFPWTDPEYVAGSELVAGKTAYLNKPFFTLRAIVYWAVWLGFARFFIQNSLRQDNGSEAVERVAKMRKWSALFVILYALSLNFASVDWYMSLSPAWFSTIYGVYHFAAMLPAAIAAIIVTILWMQRNGRLGNAFIDEDHYYNLGALLFGFCCFWGYIAWSQYLLIWYGNMPEETFYLISRTTGGWMAFTIIMALLRFGIPFIVLLPRRAKMNPTVLWWVSILVLIGHVLDMYWQIGPEMHAAGPFVNWQEIGPFALVAGVFLGVVAKFLGEHAPVPAGDPLLAASAHAEAKGWYEDVSEERD